MPFTQWEDLAREGGPLVITKGLSSGYAPIGAVVVREPIAERFRGGPRETFAHGHTFGGHPVACAAALANIAVIERERLPERAAELGPYLLDGLRSLAAHPTFGGARGLGLLAGLRVVRPGAGPDAPPDPALGRAVRLACRARGLITLTLHPGDVLFFAPPLVITRAEIDRLVEALDGALGDVERVP